MKTTLIVIVLILAGGGLAWLLVSGFGSGSGSGGFDEADAVTTTSGLKYVEVKVGDGKIAKAGDTVEVHYTGTLKDGKQFDTSRGKKPFSFELGTGNVIKGWDEGVAGMKVGGKRKLIIPPELGYGARGAAGGAIPAFSVLLFDVELLQVK